MSYLLDTNICIHLFKGHEYLVGKIEAAGINSCYLSEITILELMFGVENSAASRRSDNRENLNWLRAAFAGRILTNRRKFCRICPTKGCSKAGRTSHWGV